MQAAAEDKEDKALAAAAKAAIDKLMKLKSELATAESGCVLPPLDQSPESLKCHIASNTRCAWLVTEIASQHFAVGF